MHQLNKFFENIVVLHNINNKFRYNNILYQQEKSNLNFDIWRTVLTPYDEIIFNACKIANVSNNIKNMYANNEVLDYYKLLKFYDSLNVNNILIFEDDFQLLQNKYINLIIDSIPNDFNIINFSPSFTTGVIDENIMYNLLLDKQFCIKAKNGFWCTQAIGLSNKAIKWLIEKIEYELQPIDNYLFQNTNNNINYDKICNDIDNHYVYTLPLSYLSNNINEYSISKENDLYYYYEHFINKQMYYIYE